MKIERIPIHITPPSSVGRSKGVHVSSLIRRLALRNKTLKKEWIRNAEDLNLIELNQDAWWNRLTDTDRLRMSMGLAWEQWYLPHLGNVVHQPGEMVLDGIYMTHDGESLDAVYHTEWVEGRFVQREEFQLSVHEVKLTYKSVRTIGELETQWMVKTQAKCYCKGAGATRAYIHFLCVCGDYSYPITPQLLCFQVDFTQAEIDQTWDEIVEEAAEAQTAQDLWEEIHGESA